MRKLELEVMRVTPVLKIAIARLSEFTTRDQAMVAATSEPHAYARLVMDTVCILLGLKVRVRCAR